MNKHFPYDNLFYSTASRNEWTRTHTHTHTHRAEGFGTLIVDQAAPAYTRHVFLQVALAYWSLCWHRPPCLSCIIN